MNELAELRKRIAELEASEAERKRIEEALRSERDKLTEIMSSVDAGVDVVNQDFVIEYQNEFMVRRFGDRRGEKCYVAYMNLSRPCEFCRIHEAMRTGKAQCIELVAADGRHYELTSSRFTDVDGLVKVIEVARDVTERKQAEEALRESEEFSSSLMSNSPNPILVINPDTSVRYVSPTFEELTGFSAAEVIGAKAPYPWWTEETPHKTAEDIREIMRQGGRRLEEPFQKKSGERLRAEVNGTPVLRDGELRYYLVNWVDITERKKAEAALKGSELEKALILSSLSELVVYEDRSLRIIWANRAAAESVGSSPEQLVGRYCYEVWPQRSEPCEGCPVLKSMESGQPQRKEMRTPDGRSWFIRGDSVRDEEGQVVGAVETTLEVTERKKAEAALRESEEFRGSLLDNSPAAVLVANEDTSIRYVNPALEERTGFSSAELVGVKAPYPFWPEETRAETEKTLRKAMVQGAHNVEVQFQRKSGEKFWTEISGTPVLRDGKFLYYLANWVDITERKRAEKELQSSEEKYRGLLEGLSQAVYRMSLPDGKYEYLSPAAKGIFGYSQEDFMNTPLLIREIMHPDFADYFKEKWADLIEGKVPPTYEYKIIDPEGKERWVTQSNRGVFDEKGNIIAIEGLCANITDRKRAEQEARYQREYFKSLFASAPEAVTSIDMDKRVVEVNPAFEKLFGYAAEDIRGKDVLDYVLPEGREKEGKGVIQRVSHGEVVATETVRRTADGREIPVSLLGAPVIVEGKQVGMLGIYRDISERKRAQEELEASRQELRELADHIQSAREEERTGIARELHDDIGQALTAIKIDLSWLRKELPKDEAALLERTRAVLRVADSAIRTVRRISSELRPGILDDLGLTAAIQWQAGEFEERTGVKCEVSVEREVIVLEQDRSTAIFRIFQEALTNVARHAAATRVRVNLGEADGRLVLEIADDGKGITARQLSGRKAFGLMGMKERAAFLGGELQISGGPGKGTRVTVSIPLRREGDSAPQ